MVGLLFLSGIRYVCAAFESDKRHTKRRVRAPGEHRGHWWCWAPDRKTQIQGWSKQDTHSADRMCDTNTHQSVIHRSWSNSIEQKTQKQKNRQIITLTAITSVKTSEFCCLLCMLQYYLVYNHAFIERHTCIAFSKAVPPTYLSAMLHCPSMQLWIVSIVLIKQSLKWRQHKQENTSTVICLLLLSVES